VNPGKRREKPGFSGVVHLCYGHAHILGVGLNDSGQSGGGQKPVRIEDVAREAGVSPITVSRALSTPDKVKAETRERVLQAVEKTGYVVNSIASSLRSGRSSVVTVFVASLLNPHFASAVQGALDAFEGSRFHLMFAQTGYAEALGHDIAEILRPFRPAAVMFTGVPLQAEARAAMRRVGVPVIEVWGDGSDAIDMTAGASIEHGAQLMGAHFAQQRYRHVAYCGQTVPPGGVGLTGFRRGLEAGGGKLGHVMALEGTGTLSGGMAAFSRILKECPQCDAIFFGSDLLAVGAILAARDAGVAVPDQVAIAGYGDLDFAVHMTPALTTIRVSDYDTGRLAGLALRARLEGGETPDPIIQVPMQLVVRESTPAK
jgi:LacI family gluconate utilization system Gnt-I transcriptional repressor